MRLLAIEQHDWSIRSGLRSGLNFNVSAEALHRTPPRLRAERAANGVAVIPIMGVMLHRPDMIDYMLGGFANTAAIKEAVDTAAADRAVSAIVLKVDSPGGEVSGLAELGDSVRAAAGQKPVIASVCGTCASAAYYVASGATRIVAGRMDLVGSIGTILVVYDVSKAFDERGIRTVAIATGDYKATGTLGTELSKDQEAYLQSIVDAFFTDFRRAVVGGRRMGPDKWTQVSDGRVFPAADAVRLGLVDELLSFDASIRRLSGEYQSDADKLRARATASMLRVMEMSDLRRKEHRALKQRAELQRLELYRSELYQ